MSKRCGSPHPIDRFGACGRYVGHKGPHREMNSEDSWTDAALPSSGQPATDPNPKPRNKDAEDAEILRHGCIIEIAVLNESGSVSDYMHHWEGRALKAEAAASSERERLKASIESILEHVARIEKRLTPMNDKDQDDFQRIRQFARESAALLAEGEK